MTKAWILNAPDVAAPQPEAVSDLYGPEILSPFMQRPRCTHLHHLQLGGRESNVDQFSATVSE